LSPTSAPFPPRPPPRRLAGLPKATVAADLLVPDSAAGGRGKKGGLKSGAAPRVGVRKTITATHMDGLPLKLEMQVGGGRGGGGG
jgi:hypothetical protein